MPQLDAYIPAGALSADAERDLMAKLTDLLIRHEGADPTNETVRSIAWLFVHRAHTVYVAGKPDHKVDNGEMVEHIVDLVEERAAALRAAKTEKV